MDKVVNVHRDMSVILLRRLWDKLSAKLFIIIKIILKETRRAKCPRTLYVLSGTTSCYSGFLSLVKVTSYSPSNCIALAVACYGWAGIPGKSQGDLLFGLGAPFCLNKLRNTKSCIVNFQFQDEFKIT